jgi:hypothetical protein
VSAAGCGGHGTLAEELREYAGGALDALEPWLARVRDSEPDPAAPEPDSCTVCPLCAVLTVLRGGRSELAVTLAEQASGLLTVLRAALEEGQGGGHPAGHQPPRPGQNPPRPGQNPGNAGRNAESPGRSPQSPGRNPESNVTPGPGWNRPTGPRPGTPREPGPRVQRIPVDRGSACGTERVPRHDRC